ncbi:hypothetical protein GB2207_02607 [gamma proteobacterium HTCC2207]|uniref:DUF3604 domain-containing protein n=1 Tax=gamma proteobacterium HTCC2207 TaxID=314287 RepID=Q1YT28_9GAMM|nr:hypothetical protein GB2207_02607 [gamma proteobacterium HTCC2207]
MKIKNSLIIALIAIAFYAGWSFDQSPAVSEEIPALQVKADRAGYVVAEQIRNQDPHYSPVANQPLQKQVFWGDTHLHSNFSMDAFIFGNTLGPDDAYRFAKGEKVMATKGQPAQLREPLDFLVLADHTDGVGAMIALKAGNEKLLANPTLQAWSEILFAGEEDDARQLDSTQTRSDTPRELEDKDIRGNAWDYLTATADAHYEPGTFTPLIGFEFTAQRGGQNLHRVVIYRDDAETAQSLLPLSPKESSDPRALWDFLQQYEDISGGKVLAIAHNGNISNGLMFPTAELEFGGQMDSDYAERRARWEPVYEVTQIKGDGEAHPLLSPDDRFADYESWDLGDFAGVPKIDQMIPFEYAREALKNGLALDSAYGANPYKFGMIGSTDSHTSLATAAEDNFYGKHSAGMEPQPDRWKDAVGGRGEFTVPGFMMAASGYAAVWATENTREGIWDAIQRKEVYATTGSRMTVRFFGGWDFTQDDLHASNMSDIGYNKGVPMGATLLQSRSDAPVFMLQTAKDPNGANLDRLQVIKGWEDAEGAVHEKVFNVAWSNPELRSMDDSGDVADIPSTVDEAKATYSHKYGAAELTALWQDPEFSAEQKAFYYVRALEVPSPRWTSYDTAQFDVEMAPYVKKTTQDRAYSSPIWYEPAN